MMEARTAHFKKTLTRTSGIHVSFGRIDTYIICYNADGIKIKVFRGH